MSEALATIRDDLVHQFLSTWTSLFGAYALLVLISLYVFTHIRTNSRVDKWLLSITTIMFVIATANIVEDIIQSVGTVRYDIISTLASSTGNDVSVEQSGVGWKRLALRANTASTVLFVVNQAIGDVLLVYRCYILWASNTWVVAVPTLLIICDIACGFVAAYKNASSMPTSLLWLCPSLVANVLLTCLIAFRIWQTSRQISSEVLRNQGIRYRRIILIIVESGALYSSSLLVYVIFLALPGDSSSYVTYPAAVSRQLVGFAPTLIMVRIHFGKRVDLYVALGYTISREGSSASPSEGRSALVTSCREENRMGCTCV